ncbi:probable WRKY transcription factor 43 isoform X2 [Glycine max]|uniref:probable WRKY transcription factor 43 isoform X2 n=1 Tax=Glycine max TaxID=3847 RepID=UPI0007190F99|nr:probable WRKY transcription factor 43 isoform X2 [Glycine max]|eukprot:XP_014631997.1 probable WRKY transcription factor 43 isoform X2 [Glycine max]
MEKHQVMLPTSSTSSTPFSSDFKVDYINSTVHVENEAIRTQRKAISAQNKRDKEFIIKQHRYVFQTKSPVDVLDDGYQWRKYGKKIVKNNKFPSYYRCSHQDCNVKKQIQRHSRDEQIVVTTYEGTHTHPVDKSAESFDQILGNLLIGNLVCNVPPTLE